MSNRELLTQEKEKSCKNNPSEMRNKRSFSTEINSLVNEQKEN
jgi:hypothetical protein